MIKYEYCPVQVFYVKPHAPDTISEYLPREFATDT